MVLAAGLGMAAPAMAANLTSQVSLDSQLVDRGLAITPATPAIQAGVFWNSPAGWSAAVSGGTQLRSPGHLSEGLGRLSRYWSLSGDWQMQASLLYYHYSGIGQVSAYEVGIDWIYRDILTVGLSSVHPLGADDHGLRLDADLGFRWPLALHLSFVAGVGTARNVIAPYDQLSAPDYTVRYLYGSAGLAWRLGPWQAQLDRLAVNSGARHRLDDIVASPWLVTISRTF